jgi:chorismate lyase/3-hydroxybenzoate synthase
MTASPANFTRPAEGPSTGAEPWDLRAPAWAERLVAGGTVQPLSLDARLATSVCHTGDYSLVGVRARQVDRLEPAEFEAVTTAVYDTIAARLADLPANHAVRFWNYIPSIHQRCGVSPDGQMTLDRYMVFNAGRHTACSRSPGGEAGFSRSLATASGVGHGGGDLVVHALASTKPGVAVENPRQVPAYRYSRRYGPKPPCFARATLMTLPDGDRRLLVGGTASVRGELSVHVGNLPAQMAETVENLAALLAAAGGSSATLEALSDVRVYHVRAEDLPVLRPLCESAFPAARLEYVRADLCRRDLLVEIEGITGSLPGR